MKCSGRSAARHRLVMAVQHKHTSENQPLAVIQEICRGWRVGAAMEAPLRRAQRLTFQHKSPSTSFLRARMTQRCIGYISCPPLWRLGYAWAINPKYIMKPTFRSRLNLTTDPRPILQNAFKIGRFFSKIGDAHKLMHKLTAKIKHGCFPGFNWLF